MVSTQIAAFASFAAGAANSPLFVANYFHNGSRQRQRNDCKRYDAPPIFLQKPQHFLLLSNKNHAAGLPLNLFFLNKRYTMPAKTAEAKTVPGIFPPPVRSDPNWYMHSETA